jgi:hypothetical protein
MSVDRARARAFPDRNMALPMTLPMTGILLGRLRQITAQVVDKGCMHIALKVEVEVPIATLTLFGNGRPAA